jgi:hypothetical protein
MMILPALKKLRKPDDQQNKQEVEKAADDVRTNNAF